MRIGIDARLLEREMTGIGRILREILNRIPSLDKNNEYFLYNKILWIIFTQPLNSLPIDIF